MIAGNWKMHGTGPHLAVPEVGGALVGGASPKATDFDAIVRAISTHV